MVSIKGQGAIKLLESRGGQLLIRLSATYFNDVVPCNRKTFFRPLQNIKSIATIFFNERRRGSRNILRCSGFSRHASIHPRKFLHPDGPRFTILPSSKARTLVRYNPSPLACTSYSVPPASPSSATYVAHIDAPAPRDEHVAYLHTRRCDARVRAMLYEAVKTPVFLSPVSMRRMTAAGAPRPDIWRRQNFDAPLRPHTGIRTAVHHARVHLSNGIGADLSGILTTMLQHVCAYGWRRKPSSVVSVE